MIKTKIMRTFYDKRADVKPGYIVKTENIQAKIIWKTKSHMFIYVKPKNLIKSDLKKIFGDMVYYPPLAGYLVIPNSEKIYTCYSATGFWNGLISLFKISRKLVSSKTKDEFLEELL